MSLKAELQQWARATEAFDAGDYEASLELFYGIADSAKIHFNIGLILSMLGDFSSAVNAYIQALTLDQYFAIAYFQKGVANMSLGEFEAALEDFNDAHLYLRGNLFIDYTQIGLDYKLYACDVLYNRGLCHFELGDKPTGMNDLLAAQQDRKEKRHAIISRAIDCEGKSCPLIAVPKGIIYRPAESKVKNSKKVDYLGNSKVVAATDDADTYTGFHGAKARQASRDQSSTPIPQSSSHRMGAPNDANPYNNNQFTRMAATENAARLPGMGLTRSATTMTSSVPNFGRKGSAGPMPAIRSQTTVRRPSNAASTDPPEMVPMPAMRAIRRINTETAKDNLSVRNGPYSAGISPVDIRLANNQLNHSNSLALQGSQEDMRPGIYPRDSSESMGQSPRSRASHDRRSPRAEYYPDGPLPHGANSNGSMGSMFGDDTVGAFYDMPIKPRLNLPKGKTAVKVHFNHNIIKLIVDAHITFDALVTKLHAKITSHLQKTVQPLPNGSSSGPRVGPPSTPALRSPGVQLQSLDHPGGNDNASFDYADLLNPASSRHAGSTNGFLLDGSGAYTSPQSSTSTLPPSPNGSGAARPQPTSVPLTSLRIRYRDEDDELVLMTDQEDFELAKGYMGGDMSCPQSNVVERLELWCSNE
ncbi:hypothetical protein H4R35_006710 [Dimargaris xerosporica]|nr:hypothetical protein H4R35_006710 [Dimargaris xerosporica]